MKQITKIEQVPKELVKFVADDGTEFDKEQDCRNYERDHYRKLLDESGIETCEKNCGLPNFDGGECYESHQYYWYRPKNEVELELLSKAFELDGDSSARSDFCPEMVGKWICVETDCTDDFLWVNTLDGGIEYAKRILENLGFTIVVQEVANNE